MKQTQDTTHDADYMVPIRGKIYHFAVHPDNAFLFMIISSLLNLNDPRIDEVLSAFSIELKDSEGNTIFSRDEGFVG